MNIEKYQEIANNNLELSLLSLRAILHSSIYGIPQRDPDSFSSAPRPIETSAALPSTEFIPPLFLAYFKCYLYFLSHPSNFSSYIYVCIYFFLN